tara:strand:- start:1017 stop:1802 length:786 start_codon:yes stop_codon:yes gene_type:complete
MDKSDIIKGLETISNANIVRHTSNDRWYAKEGTMLWRPSVTTIIGGAISKGIGYDTWLGNQPSYKAACEERDEAAARGTFVHNSVEQLIQGQELKISEEIPNYEEICKHLMSFERFWKEQEVEVVGTELFLYNEDVPWAGTPDIIAYVKGHLSIIDLKTGNYYKSHEVQLNMYAILLEKLLSLEENSLSIYGLYTKGRWIKEPNYGLKCFKRNNELPYAIESVWAFLNSSTRGKPWPKDKYEIQKIFNLGGENDADDNFGI